jgi:hypothetical protein
MQRATADKEESCPDWSLECAHLSADRSLIVYLNTLVVRARGGRQNVLCASVNVCVVCNDDVLLFKTTNHTGSCSFGC